MGKQSDIVNFHNCFEREGFGNIYLIHQPNPNAKHIDDVPFLQECFPKDIDMWITPVLLLEKPIMDSVN